MKTTVSGFAPVLTAFTLFAACEARSTENSTTSNASATTAQAEDPNRDRNAPDREDINKLLEGWPAGPRLAGQEMIAKYGPPQETTSHRVIWQQAGPYKRIMLTREELPHDFPITHMDYLEHTISYNVPPDKTDDVHAFDASITIYRVAGELSARCDLESNNVLTLNLANDIVTGKKTVDAARQEFGQAVSARTMGNPPPSTVALQFQPMDIAAAIDPEKTSLPGTSQRAQPAKMALTGAAPKPSVDADAEILALLIALDENEVHAAMAAQEKKVGEQTLSYARTLHQDHGRHIQETEQLGMKMGVTPMETEAVNDLHNKGAAQLATLVPLSGSDFEERFARAMADGHKDALRMIDEWSGKASSPVLKQHLSATRQHIERHAQAADGLTNNR